MKARSVIFSHQQFPPTIFGLPPILTLLSMAGGAVGYVGAVLAGMVPIALIIAALVAAAGLAKSYRLGKADRHIESVFLTSFSFWGNSSHRGLTAGAPSPRSRIGGRS